MTCGSVYRLLARVCTLRVGDGPASADILHHFRDQLCSLAFPLSNIYFVSCSYARGFRSDPIQACSKPGVWVVPFLLAALPLVARFGQSIRRWWDSGLMTHLINVRRSSVSDVERLKFGIFIFRAESILQESCIIFATICGDIMASNSPSGRCR
jgi:hypothetical protein